MSFVLVFVFFIIIILATYMHSSWNFTSFNRPHVEIIRENLFIIKNHNLSQVTGKKNYTRTTITF